MIDPEQPAPKGFFARLFGGKDKPPIILDSPEAEFAHVAQALGLSQASRMTESDFIDAIEASHKGGMIDWKEDPYDIAELLVSLGVAVNVDPELFPETDAFCEACARASSSLRFFETGSDYMLVIVVDEATSPKVDSVLSAARSLNVH